MTQSLSEPRSDIHHGPSSSGVPTVSVVVPHYHDLAGLNRCLESLERQTYPRDRFEIIVGDNNSPEGLAAVADAIAGRASLAQVMEKGAGPARNGAVSMAKNEILAFIDADCVAEPEWLAEAVKGLAAYDFIGGRVKVLVDDESSMKPVEAFERVFAFDFKTYITKKGFTGTGNLFCARNVFDRVGGFRPAVSEDVEWCGRARGLGFRLGYVPTAIVGHPARRTWAELLNKWQKTHSETFALLSDRPGGRWRWLVRTLALPASAVAHTPKVLRSPELNTLGQRLAALSTLYRIRAWRFADGLKRTFS